MLRKYTYLIGNSPNNSVPGNSAYNYFIFSDGTTNYVFEHQPSSDTLIQTDFIDDETIRTLNNLIEVYIGSTTISIDAA